MSLEDTIRNFPEQLKYEPRIENAGLSFGGYKKFVVVGMGGSNLAAEIIKSWKPKLDVVIHRDYGLPAQIFSGKTWEGKPAQDSEYLIICSSFSGNTEETIGAFNEAFARGLPLAVIAAGGGLLDLAQKNGVPYVQLPDIGAHPVRSRARDVVASPEDRGAATSNGTHPRFAIGLSIKATLKVMGEELVLGDVGGVAESLGAGNYEEAGENLAHALENKIPLIYSSARHRGLAYFWKVNFNETVKIPAFFNVFPELNHNEMAGFGQLAAKDFGPEKFAFVFLTDPDDEPRIQKRMEATAKVFEEKGFTVLKTDIVGPSLWHKSFAGILASFWTAFYLAKHYGVDPEDVSVIEEFKKALG
jgi:glucose/mannose-6-phosphate isomerase